VPSPGNQHFEVRITGLSSSVTLQTIIWCIVTFGYDLPCYNRYRHGKEPSLLKVMSGKCKPNFAAIINYGYVSIWMKHSQGTIDCLIDYLRFYVLLNNFSLTWRPLPVKGWKFSPMLGAQGLWAGRNLYRATSAVTWNLIRRTTPYSRLLQHTRGYGGE
jgi:hypothetical protein